MAKLFVEANINFEEKLERMDRLTQTENLNLILCAYKYQEGNGELIFDTYLTTEKRNENDIYCFDGKDVRKKWSEYLIEEENKEMTSLFGEDWGINEDNKVDEYYNDEDNRNQWIYKAWQNTWKYFSHIILDKTVFSVWDKKQDGKKICGQVAGCVKCIYRNYNMKLWAESHEDWRAIMEGDQVVPDENESEVWNKYYSSKE